MNNEAALRVVFLCTGNYFRSRFAELLFNELAAARGLRARAESAGLAPDCHRRNPGPISPHTLRALRERGFPICEPLASPRDATLDMFDPAHVVVALKEAEHRPRMLDRFPTWADRIRYWHVHDIPIVLPDEALAQIDALVHDLVDELGASQVEPGNPPQR